MDVTPPDLPQGPLMSRVFQYALTGPDDHTYELVEIIGACGFIIGVILEVVDFILQWHTGTEGSFNFLSYMGGLSAGMAALAGSQRIRDGRSGGGA
jgi:hypothetical protein